MEQEVIDIIEKHNHVLTYQYLDVQTVSTALFVEEKTRKADTVEIMTEVPTLTFNNNIVVKSDTSFMNPTALELDKSLANAFKICIKTFNKEGLKATISALILLSMISETMGEVFALSVIVCYKMQKLNLGSVVDLPHLLFILKDGYPNEHDLQNIAKELIA